LSPRQGWRWALAPLVPLYAAGLAIKDKLRAAGMLKTHRLGWPVISVGSLSAGGAGKTPAVIALAGLLRARGWAVDVLSRGYGRKGRDVECVKIDGENPAWWYGDEPVLIARRTGVPVWVGAQRFEAGQLAEAAEGAPVRGVHLLDDGFQHRQLARTVDVVMVTEHELDDALLPMGNLREPLRALRRADVVVLREDERERVEPRLRGLVRGDAALWTVRRELRFPDGMNAVMRPVAFCATGRPKNFWQMLDDVGCAPAAQLEFADHHHYEAADIERLVQLAADSGGNGFVTTEKDAVKLSPRLLEGLHTIGPVNVAALDAVFPDEAAVAGDLEARLK
jgi:tetraacyldisaccharide 4'-kinase